MVVCEINPVVLDYVCGVIFQRYGEVKDSLSFVCSNVISDFALL